jgi:hypothetical protein
MTTPSPNNVLGAPLHNTLDVTPGYPSHKRARTSSPTAVRREDETAIRLGSDFDGADDEDKGVSSSSSLSEMQRRHKPCKRAPSQQKKYDGKLPWTDEEKRAIKEGFRRFGKEKCRWAKIKKDNNALFEHRTSGQIKVSSNNGSEFLPNRLARVWHFTKSSCLACLFVCHP